MKTNKKLQKIHNLILLLPLLIRSIIQTTMHQPLSKTYCEVIFIRMGNEYLLKDKHFTKMINKILLILHRYHIQFQTNNFLRHIDMFEKYKKDYNMYFYIQIIHYAKKTNTTCYAGYLDEYNMRNYLSQPNDGSLGNVYILKQ